MTAREHSVSAALAELHCMLSRDDPAAARLEAQLLLGAVLGRGRTWLIAHGDDPMPRDALERVRALACRRATGEPIAHLLGRREFWSLDLQVNRDVLIPRPDTELLVERALVRLDGSLPARVCDLGTGSGAVAIAIARERPRAWVAACDASRAALRVAAANTARLAPGRIALAAASWLSPFTDHAFDVLVANPPYVASGDPHLERGDLRFEPRGALAAGDEGLDDIRAIAADAPRALRAGGWLLLEHGADQGPAVRALLASAGFGRIDTHRDLAGLERVTEGRARG